MQNIIMVDEPYLAHFMQVREAWRDRGMTMLLIVQTTVIFGVFPLAAIGVPVPAALGSGLLLLSLVLVGLISSNRLLLASGFVVLSLAIVLAALLSLHRSLAAELAFNASSMLTSALLCVAIGESVFRPGHFSNHRIRGAVLLYLNVGLFFAFLHRIVAELIPGAYSNLPSVDDPASFRAALDYFSYSTLTTVGYGDIAPVNPVSRALSTLEASLGQLIPTLLIGRVLSHKLKDE